MNSQLDRIRQAEGAIKELLEYSAKARCDLEDIREPDLRKEVIEAIDGVEREAQRLGEALRNNSPESQ